MGKNKQLLLLLFSIAIYVLYASDYDQKIEEIKTQINFLNMKIVREESIKSKKKEILEKVNSALEIAKSNEKYLFKDQNNSEIQSQVQNYLNKVAQDTLSEFLGASWEEPLIYEDFGYTELPISTSVKGTPPSLAQFFYKINRFEKLINVKSLEIGKVRPYRLLFAFRISTYKMEGEKEEQKK